MKFGKTESGAVWLDPERTSPYRFYQFWLTADDRDVSRYLRFFTLLPRAEINGLDEALRDHPGEREAHRRLAEETTMLLHGEHALAQAKKASQIFFGGEIAGVGEKELMDIFADVPSKEVASATLDGEGVPIIDLLVTAGLAGSKGDARRSLQGGGISLNNVRVQSETQRIMKRDALHGKFVVLRKGARNYAVVKLI